MEKRERLVYTGRKVGEGAGMVKGTEGYYNNGGKQDVFYDGQSLSSARPAG